jgi:hypothetical protein
MIATATVYSHIAQQASLTLAAAKLFVYHHMKGTTRPVTQLLEQMYDIRY